MRTGIGPLVPGPTNSLADVPGLAVGHETLRGPGRLSGTTVVLAAGEGLDDPTRAADPGSRGAIGGVDVRGGGPGTRETDLLDPRNVVERVHAICLSGGSAFGLAAADGVARALFADGIGLPMGGPGEVVPIVPGAVVFDLGRGGDFAAAPDASSGAAAYAAAASAARTAASGGPTGVAQGCVGAGTGATVGGLKGGIGTASTVLPDGTRVAVLLVLNALGEAVDARDGTLWAARHLLPGELDLVRPDAADLAEAARRAAAAPPLVLGRPGTATTIGVVATDATLTKAQCAKLAGLAHDGLARGVNPVHTMFDGDTFFGLSTTRRPPPDLAGFHAILTAAGDTATRAVAHAVVAATGVGPTGPGPRGDDPGAARFARRSYADAFPSAVSGLHPRRRPTDDPPPQRRP